MISSNLFRIENVLKENRKIGNENKKEMRLQLISGMEKKFWEKLEINRNWKVGRVRACYLIEWLCVPIMT